jgi:hypothetical protein
MVQARRVTATDHDIQYGYCGLTTLMTNVTGEAERSLIVGSAYGMVYYMRNLADNAVALRGRQPLMGQQGAVLQHPFPRYCHTPTLTRPLTNPIQRTRTHTHTQ